MVGTASALREFGVRQQFRVPTKDFEFIGSEEKLQEAAKIKHLLEPEAVAG